MQTLANSAPAKSARSLGPKINTRGASQEVAEMIKGHLRSLKNRDAGIRSTLEGTYRLSSLDATDVSVCARSGLDQEAYDKLLKAWTDLHPAKVH